MTYPGFDRLMLSLLIISSTHPQGVFHEQRYQR
jgi:hypothetical protein